MGLAKGFGSSTLTFGKVVLPAAKEDQSRNLRLPHPRHATMATGERLAGERLHPSFNLDHGALGRRQVGLSKTARLLSRAARESRAATLKASRWSLSLQTGGIPGEAFQASTN